MKAHIYEPYIGRTIDHRLEEMTKAELAALRFKIARNLCQNFDWSEVSADFSRCIYYAEIDGEAYIYPYGYLMSAHQYDDVFAVRKDLQFVGTLYRR